MLILLAATLGISITNIVIGATNLNSNCTGIDTIPAYLITSGVLGLVIVLIKGSDNDEEDDADGKDEGAAKKSQKQMQITNLFYLLIQLASIGVQIWGSVILFNINRPECDLVLYDYAIAVNITTYALLAMILIIYCCAFGVVCCEACANKCCGDGDGECKYQCTCCNRICCADDATNSNLQSEQLQHQPQTNTIPNVVPSTLNYKPTVIEMPPLKNIETTQSNYISEC